ncbi:MAG: putative Universal stress protein UspA-like [Rickettsiaceae bacterium]|jgi:nucleotide-binding universal stress UspA family protein|nr:putative Universal stress protein UspA-like [Rickettsiaceae bacterium]
MKIQESKPTLVVCVDVSASSDVTLRYACQIAKKSGFAVHILVVTESAQSLLFVSKVVEKDRRKEVEKKLKTLIDNACKETGTIPVVSIREGEVVREIAAEIKSLSACVMLVFGKSYGSRSDNNVLPKLSAQIGNKIKVPVVIVPDNLSEEYMENLKSRLASNVK